MVGFIDWNAFVQFLAGHIIELIIAGGTTTTAIGLMRVRRMLVDQITVQTIVFSEAAAQEIANRNPALKLSELRVKFIDTYREILRMLKSLTAPMITRNVAAQLISRIKVLSALMSRAATEGVINQVSFALFTEFENKVIELITDLVSSQRKAHRHWSAVEAINRVAVNLLMELGDEDMERRNKILESNIMPANDVFFRLLFAGRARSSDGIKF